MVKNLSANAVDTKDVDLVCGSGRSSGRGNGRPLSILGWKIPWIRSLAGLEPVGLQKSRT